MGRRRPMTAKRRLAIFDAAEGICHICGLPIDQHKAWEVSHVIPLELGGEDTDENTRPAHYACHRQHTAKVDIPKIAKAKRVEAKHRGAWRRPKRLIPGSKGSGWKAKIGGGGERV